MSAHRGGILLVAIALFALGCGASSPGKAQPPPASSSSQPQPTHTVAFVGVEETVIDWLAAADPRLAIRANVTAPQAVLARIGGDAVLAEDASAQIRGGSLDVFAFHGRARALQTASKLLAAFGGPLPETAPPDSPLARPQLERELLGRLIEEEGARAADEALLGDTAGDLVRAVVSTWTPPAVPEDWQELDAWVSRHLLEIRESLRDGRPRGGPLDLDIALYPLERLLAPLQFPRGSAAIAKVRVALDEDTRAVAPLVAPDRVAHLARLHLGVSLDTATVRPRLERIEVRLRELASKALLASGDSRPAIEARARALLFVEGPCPPVPASRVRAMVPPPERAPICGALRALTEDPQPAAALVALHDDVFLAFAAISTSPPARTGLLCKPDDDVVDSLRRLARERPVVVLGVVLAAELLYGNDGADARLKAWRSLGEAPLDVVARELGVRMPQ